MIKVMGTHNDFQSSAETAESTTLEAGYTFIKTQRQTAVLQYVQNKETTHSTGLKQCLQIPEPHTISHKNLLTLSERINGLRPLTWSSTKPTIAQRDSPLSPGKKQ